MARQAKIISGDDAVRAEASIAELERTVKFLVTDYTVEFLAGKVRDEEYYIPEYQREFSWNDDAQSRFVESLLMGLPIPFLFLWQANDGRLEIVDGSQRLRTIVRFMDDGLALKNLKLLPLVEGFRFSNLDRSRQRKLSNQTLRGIVLDTSVSEATRTEMFNRINTGGTKLNDAEVRRGSLPGPFTDLIMELSTDERFVALTPVSAKAVREREREELLVRFFTYLERLEVVGGELDLPGWRDRPREFIWDFVKTANAEATADLEYINRLRTEFDRTMRFVEAAFPNGFRKSPTGSQVPRVRFEAIAVGSALALRANEELLNPPIEPVDWADGDEFSEVTTSDAANVKSKLLRRISYVFVRLSE
ncbi:DUF262 domain-containing protein [Citromicrobium sp. WPS32]|uniref:DUF262 domain-containing protein n=1 Tax=Citromicrobium sp. WPS32 TaxID=1634517 RepID=UPI0006DAE4DB|nr:DUF262 domain-containing protein [Citromicrobium sp. WPS32]KPM18072.1 hypothetical protein WG75_02225 [Citromicrobium sp. WPS32]MAY78294.1 DUF262 domain-containing protein [Citromicrobium sp.]MAY78347.1 DUF262 domain-containing protein [Citromicrobium sp.]|tara:strand:+ start:895 stop:1983 length:1089 start_codon:yes stop_codon:yes gene_type:complete